MRRSRTAKRGEIAELKRRYQNSVGKAFEEVLSEHLAALYRTSLRLCAGREADAEDLLQDAMLRAFEGYAELKDTAAAKSWLFTILVRTNLNRIRASSRRAETLAADMDVTAFEEALANWTPLRNPEEELFLSHLRENIRDALDSLDASLREAVWLVDVEGFRLREVGTMLGLPEGTVASRLFRARRALRELLRGEDGIAGLRVRR